MLSPAGRSSELNRGTLKVARKPYLAEKIVLVDGLPGNGKTMLSPIVGAMPGVEIMQYSYPLEYICALRFLDRMEEDAACVLIRILTDLQLYNVMMGRETNFRLTDLSGVFRCSHSFRYLLRIFRAGDQAVIDRIRTEKPILHLTTHHVLGFSSAIFAALDSRVSIIELVRHPLYMIKQQALYMDRYGSDARDFTIWYDYDGVQVPYFALGWEDVYLRANAVEKSIYFIYHYNKRLEELGFSSESSGNRQVHIIPFERFVTDPWPYMVRLEKLLGTETDGHTRRMMRKQNVPRKMYAEGIGLPIYKQYGWEAPAKGSNERKELERRRSFAAEQASPPAMEILDEMCEQYEKRYLLVENKTQ